MIEESKLKGSISEISLPKNISSIETYLIQRRQQEKSDAIEAFSALLREARQTVLQQVEADFDPLPFDAQAARAFGRVAASLRRSGRRPAARSNGAMIAAVAIANDLPLFTCNPEDFQGIEDLTIVGVPYPGQA